MQSTSHRDKRHWRVHSYVVASKQKNANSINIIRMRATIISSMCLFQDRLARLALSDLGAVVGAS